MIDIEIENSNQEIIEPTFEATAARTITVRLIGSDDEADCNFWIGLFKKGHLSPASLHDAESVLDIIEKSAKEGITDDEPVMLTNCNYSPTRYTYLLPVPSESFKERAIWLGELTRTIKSWKLDKIGIYLDKSLIDSESANELILQTLREIIFQSSTSDFYIMIGKHGMNSVINAVLRLKEDVNPDTTQVYVFH